MKISKKAILIFSIICILMSSAIVLASPGDSSDPLVTLTYITDVLLPDVDARIERKVNEVQSATFKLINVDAGDVIYGEMGTELMVRSGGATIIAGKNGGGIADLTSGSDLAGDTYVQQNLVTPLLTYKTMYDGFTRQEQRIFKKILERKSKAKIAEELNIVSRSVDNYISRILEKTGCNRIEEVISKFGE